VFSDEVPKLQSKVNNLMLKLEDTALSSSTVVAVSGTTAGNDAEAAGMTTTGNTRKSSKKKKSPLLDQDINDTKESAYHAETDSSL
jgi:hypothetical protein